MTLSVHVKMVLSAFMCILCGAASLEVFAESAAREETTSVRLTAVSPESLINLRSPRGFESTSPELVENGVEVAHVDVDGLSDQLFAPIALVDAFPTLPVCQEWAPSGTSPRFPFAVEANERLIDALDKLHQSSEGFMDWALLHERMF